MKKPQHRRPTTWAERVRPTEYEGKHRPTHLTVERLVALLPLAARS